MNDNSLEILALIAIIFGLIIAFFFVLDYEPTDGFFLNKDDSNIYFSGEVIKKSYNFESGYTFLELNACRTFNAFYEGEIGNGSKISFSGEYNEGVFSIKQIR